MVKLLDIYFSSILENMQDAVIGIDVNGKIIIINRRAKELLNISYEDVIGKKITDVVSESKLISVINNENVGIDENFIISGKHFIVNRVPVETNGQIYGALALFNDITDYRKISKRLDEDEGYIDILNTIMDTVNEWVVVVDKDGIITMMSKAYKDFLKVPNPEGKHVTEVIENTRMHIVAKTGKALIGDIQEIKGNRMIAMRVPIKKDGKVIGAVGKVMFKDISDFLSLSKKLNKLEQELEYYKKELDNNRVAKYSFRNIIGNSKSLMKVKKIAEKAARTNSNVLIIGESGTGKELFAHAIHNASERRLGPFVKINCAAIPSELLESELFGYEEGAFTGAKKGGKKGKFELANGGTILLDEIGDMPLNMQAKLLRVLQEKELERVGGNIVQNLDVRIIASTNKDLEELVKNKKFRQDLYYRLNVMTVSLPPLRERREDIKELAIAIKTKLTKRLGIYVEGITEEALDYLANYNWPGNIRELENVIERAINLLDSDLLIKPEHLPKRITKNTTKFHIRSNRKLKNILEEVEKEVILEYLQENNGNKNKTAKMLGISRVNLYKKLEKYDLKDV
jgi:PAS domain S-box-containing protein